MDFIQINSIEEDSANRVKFSNNNLKRTVMEFYKSGYEVAKMRYNSEEYSTSQSLYSGLNKAIQTFADKETGVPGIPVEAKMFRGQVYLARAHE